MVDDLCIIKIGGAAITIKDSLESLNDALLDHFVEFVVKPLVKTTKVVIIHGAGSFGHFQAKQYALTLCNQKSDVNPLGVSLTQQSVRKLNSIVISKLLKHDIPAVHVSPFPSWITNNATEVVHCNSNQIISMLSLGLVPVLHGDVILDQSKHITVLSGDLIASHLSKTLKPNYVTFITDVDGVFDIPPNQPNAKLIRDIQVDKNGNLVTSFELSGSAASHDVTGGMKSKIDSCFEIIKQEIPVYIAKAGTEHSVLAARGEFPSVGTRLSLNNKLD